MFLSDPDYVLILVDSFAFDLFLCASECKLSGVSSAHKINIILDIH